MPRYIEADALYMELVKLKDFGELTAKKAIREVKNAPTIDAEPVRHGKWIGYAGTIGNECSVCGKWLDVLQGTAEMNYCPNCGARMDEE